MAFIHAVDPHQGCLQYVYDIERDGFTQIARDCFSGHVSLSVPADLIVQVSMSTGKGKVRYIVKPNRIPKEDD